MTVEVLSASDELGSTGHVPVAEDDQLTDQKKIEFYAATVNAWYATTLEHDKSLFVLAGGGIGVMISLLTTVGFNSYWVLPLFVGAIAGFFISLIYLLKIFDGNRDYLDAVINDLKENSDANLKCWDKVAKYSFFIGVFFSAAVGITAAALKINKEQVQMANEKQPTSTRAISQESLHNSVILQPMVKSFQGAASMAPASSPAVTPATSGSSATQATPTAATPPVLSTPQGTKP